jgi:hypothetical protein
MRRDLASARRFSLIPFNGSYDEFTFAAVRGNAQDPSEPAELGRMGYYLDERRKLLCRSFVPYRMQRRMDLKDACQIVLEGVSRVRFEYFGASEADADPSWDSGWDTAVLPAAVKASIILDRGGTRTSTEHAVVYVPASRQAAEDHDA